MKTILSIKRLAITIAVLLLCLLAKLPAGAQIVVHQGETTNLTVQQMPGDTYTWELYSDPTVNFAVDAGDPSPASYAEFVDGNDGPSVNVLWKVPGTYFVKVTGVDAAGCTNNLKVILITVLPPIPTAIIAAGPAVCVGVPFDLTVTLTGTGPWTFTYTDGTTEWTVTEPNTSTTPPAIIHTIHVDPGPALDTQYWITSVTDSNETNTVPSERTTQQIDPLPTPSLILHR